MYTYDQETDAIVQSSKWLNPDLTSPSTQVVESIVRDMAARVISAEDTRRNHPSFGYTKTRIRSLGDEMEGAITVYQIMTRQTSNPGMTNVAEFMEERTAFTVEQARKAIARL